jgi:hypothetical protein
MFTGYEFATSCGNACSNLSTCSDVESSKTDVTQNESIDDDDDFIDVRGEQHLAFPMFLISSLEDFDNASLSSASSGEDKTSFRRKIFHEYVNSSSMYSNMARKSCIFEGGSHECTTEGDHCEVSIAKECKFQEVDKEEKGSPEQPLHTNYRRRIFFEHQDKSHHPVRKYEPRLDQRSMLPSWTKRHALSDSALLKKPTRSCLRSSTLFNDMKDGGRFHRYPSVSFSDTVTFVRFEIPQEQWAANGWTQHFH